MQKPTVRRAFDFHRHPLQKSLRFAGLCRRKSHSGVSCGRTAEIASAETTLAMRNFTDGVPNPSAGRTRLDYGAPDASKLLPLTHLRAIWSAADDTALLVVVINHAENVRGSEKPSPL